MAAQELEQGVLLLGDLGTTTYLQRLDVDNASVMYAEALEALVKIQQHSAPGVLPEYDRAFLLRENPAAARAIAERLDAARRNGWWHPRRNDIDADLRAMMAEAASLTRPAGAAPARACRPRCRPATACWCDSR